MVLSNFVCNGNPQQLHILADNQVIDVMVKQLECEDNRELVAIVVKCFSKLMLSGIKYTEKLNSANTSHHLIIFSQQTGLKNSRSFSDAVKKYLKKLEEVPLRS